MNLETPSVAMRDGKSHGKDIMLLCKGWHNKEKYKTTKDALVAYYNKHYRYLEEQVEDLQVDFINKVLLQPAIFELADGHYMIKFITCLFEDISTVGSNTYSDVLYYRLVKFLSSLRIQLNDGTVVINTSSYWKSYSDNCSEGTSQRMLAEEIIE